MKYLGKVSIAIILICNGCASKNLHQAAFEGNVPMMGGLITDGADINLKNKNGDTPLMFAVRGGHYQAVQLLLDKGAKLDEQDILGNTAFGMAIKNENLGMIKLFITNGVDSNCRSKDGTTALMVASKWGILDDIKLIISKGSDVNLVDSIGNSALMLAVSRGKMDLVDYLLSIGANINAAKNNGVTPLLLAIQRRDTNIAQYLIENGSNVNISDANGYTPLTMAIYYNSIAMVKLLLANNEDINTQDKKGDTPLMYAIERDAMDIARLLLDAGINLDIVNQKGYAAADKAHEYKRYALEKILQSKNAKYYKYGRREKYDDRIYIFYLSKGNASITGQAFCKTRGGDVKFAAGETVFLVPNTGYSLEVIKREVINDEYVYPPIDERYNKIVRTTIADGSGHFKFREIPAGDYVVYCDIYWEVPDKYGMEQTGSKVMAIVHVNEGEEKEIMVTPESHIF